MANYMLWVQTLFPQDKQQQQCISTLSSTVIFGTNLLHPLGRIIIIKIIMIIIVIIIIIIILKMFNLCLYSESDLYKE